MALEDELLAIRLELKGVSKTVDGLGEVDAAQQGVGTSAEVAGSKAEIAGEKIGGAYDKAHTQAKLALGFIGVGGAFALEKAVNNTEELAVSTTTLSRNLGLNTQRASEWASTASAFGIESKSLGMAFGTLSSKATEAARKGGSLLTPFHQLGISQEELVKHGNDFEWVLRRVTKALEDEEGGTKRTTAAKAILGRGYQTLLPILNQGSEGLEKQLHLSGEYGETFSKAGLESAYAMKESQREVDRAMTGIEMAMTKVAAPAIEGAEDVFKEFAQTMTDTNLSPEQKIAKVEEQFEGLEDNLISILEKALPGVAEHVGQLGEKIADGVWHGFEHSSVLGKAVIAAYVFNLFGGSGLVKMAASKAGGQLAKYFMRTFFAGTAAEIAATEAVGGASAAGGIGAGTVAEGAGAGAAGALALPLGIAGGAILAGHLSTTQAGEELLGRESPAEEARTRRRYWRARAAEKGTIHRREHQQQGPFGVPFLPGTFGTSTILPGQQTLGPPAPSTQSRPDQAASLKPLASAIGSAVAESTEKALRNNPVQVTVQPIIDGQPVAESTTKHAARKKARR